jgi:hypothetical protein
MIKILSIIFFNLIFFSCNQFVFSQQFLQISYFVDNKENIKLRQWWKSLDSDWQWVFLGKFEFSSKNPNDKKLKYFTNIKKLSCDSNHLMTLEPLRILSKLEILEMPNILIKDVSPLKNLVNLKKLVLNSNSIENIKSLSGLKNLKILNLSLTEVKDLTPLKNLYNLEELYLDENTINSLKPLYNLKKLKILSIINTKINKKEIDDFKKINSKCLVEIK